MQFGFIHTDHLSSPISNLLLGHCRRRQQSTTSIFNLRSHIWGGWLGARIYNLHSPSPISTFWPCCCSERSAIHNLNLRSLVLNGEPDRRDLLARLGRVRVRDPLGSPVLIYYLYPNDLLVLRRDFHYSSLFFLCRVALLCSSCDGGCIVTAADWITTGVSPSSGSSSNGQSSIPPPPPPPPFPNLCL